MKMQVAPTISLPNLDILTQFASIFLWGVVIALLLVGCYKQLSVWARALKVGLAITGICVPSKSRQNHGLRCEILILVVQRPCTIDHIVVRQTKSNLNTAFSVQLAEGQNLYTRARRAGHAGLWRSED